MNPIDEALEAVKTAGIGDLASGFARGAMGLARKPGIGPLTKSMEAGMNAGQSPLVQNVVGGAGLAAGGAAITALGAAAAKIYEGIARKGEYREMMAVNPELEYERQKNPEFFAQAYNSLRRVNPTFGRDPIIASSFMHKMMLQGPVGAGATLAGTVKTPEAPKRGINVQLDAGPMHYQRHLPGAP